MGSLIQFHQPAPQSKFNACHRAVVDALESAAADTRLLPSQLRALRGLQNHFADSTKPSIALVVLPRGAGKSGVVALAPYVLNATRVLVITPSIIITNQINRDMNSTIPTETFYVRYHLCTPADLHFMLENGHVIKGPLDDNAERVTAQLNRHNLVIANAHKFGSTSNVNIEQLPRTLLDLVIVDEAHHYPAPTWKNIIDHFSTSKGVFLTATPYHRGHHIVGSSLNNQEEHYIACQVSRQEAVTDMRISRPVDLISVGAAEHTEEEQGDGASSMILVYTIDQADGVVDIINTRYPNVAHTVPKAVAYHGKSGTEGFKAFREGGRKFLVLCGKATEGFDRPEVSVVGILRNVAASSRVLFNQFVGRCVRRKGADDVITAWVVSHVRHAQEPNFRNMDGLAEVDPEDD
ncbi:hypothetical protein HDU85_002961 [Gaertneriomyces sp. JEL0708]|nr:hypothetical protein HDU85_002961 [Gaertneriomyces sp. JEL0708]